MLTDEQRDALIARYRLPVPPVAFGALLRGLATATVDVSDGLVADLGHVAQASDMKIVLDAAAIPRSAALRAFWGDDAAAIVRAVTVGDDYQIAFTAADHDGVMTAARDAGVIVTRIGETRAGQGIELLLDGAPLAVARPGYRHFQGGGS